MPDVLLAGPVLEKYQMKKPINNPILAERLIDVREAAYFLNLPMYLLTHPKERERIGVPHYRVGKMVRFKLNELMDWMKEKEVEQNA
ncbi:MAG: hypothetical protein RLZZ192_1116 [Pseudomonadota bacterium]|jgi:hypothetical protein